MNYKLSKKSKEFLDKLLMEKYGYEGDPNGTIELRIANGDSSWGYSMSGPTFTNKKVSNRDVNFHGHVFLDFKCGKEYGEEE